MNDIETGAGTVDRRKGNIVIGIMLVLTGLAVLLERAGLVHWSDQWTLWPLILGGIGLARLLDSAPGEPKQGLLFLTASAWLLVGEAGWVSLEDSWPIAVIVFGLIVALNSGRRRRPRQTPDRPDEPADPRVRRRRRPDHPLSPLAMLGVWIAIFIGLQVSGIRSFNSANASEVGASGRVRVVSVMGRSEHISRAAAFQGADVTNVMGRTELDLRNATLAPGAHADVHLFSAMGTVVLRVPPTWTVDTGAVSAFGGLRDDRPAAPDQETTTGPAPRLVLRGLVMMGRLSITS